MIWDCKYSCFILMSEDIHPYKRWHCACFRNIDVTSKWHLPGEQECSTAYAGPEWLEPRQSCSEVSPSSGCCSMATAALCSCSATRDRPACLSENYQHRCKCRIFFKLCVVFMKNKAVAIAGLSTWSSRMKMQDVFPHWEPLGRRQVCVTCSPYYDYHPQVKWPTWVSRK